MDVVYTFHNWGIHKLAATPGAQLNDVRQHAQAEQRYRHALRVMTSTIASSAKPLDVLQRALATLCDTFDCPSAVMYRLDDDCTNLHAVVFHGIGERVAARLRFYPLDRSASLRDVCTGARPHVTHEDGLPELSSRFSIELGFSDARWIVLPIPSDERVIGVVGFLGPGSHPFSDEDVSAMQIMVHQLASHLVRLRESEDASSTRRQLENDLRASHAMLRAAEAMSDKTDLQAVLQALAEVVHEELRRQVIVTLVDKKQHAISIAAGAGPAEIPYQRLPLSNLDPVLMQSLVEHRSVVIETGSLPSALGMPSGRFLSVPLVNEGTLVGNVEVDDPPTDRGSLSREIRLLQGIAFQAVSAIANARLYEQQRRSASLRQALNDVNAILNESIDRPGLLQPVIERAMAAFPADSAVVALLQQDDWVVEHSVGIERVRSGDRLSAADAANAKHALRANAPLLRPESEVPAPLEASVGSDGGLVLLVPLQLKGRTFGAMFFRRNNWLWALDSEMLDFASKLGASVSLTLGNRYLYEHEHLIAETLQQALLSVPDAVPGVSMGHLYLAAAERTRVGGDFYDLFELPDGKVVMAIGDVSGKGLDAAALTALVKNTLKAHAVEGLPPHEILERANEIVYQFSSAETFVTVFLAVLDVENGHLEYANGGHLAPIAFSKGTTRPLAVEGQLLGAFPGVKIEDNRTLLLKDECLFLYTDGLTEARGPNGELYSEERLERTLTKMQGVDVAEIPAIVVADVEEFATCGLSDDVAILALRLEPRARPKARRGIRHS
jgi:serine phosphatase RsbU (regulator of sigma subunit)/GAF domain-containing protein